MSQKSLYERLGGYDGISVFANDLVSRLQSDTLLGRFWENRSDDSIVREKQLLIDFLCDNAGGPLYYTGRDMKLSHKGMQISQSDWEAFFGHAAATMQVLKLAQQECDDVAAFVTSLKDEIVEA